MKGFKSFADTTTLEFEPGVTAVVGPNGSGKSNVVDAVTWVLGAQSTRALRSVKMDDVIFAGTVSRTALGRAEVSLTIDNSSGKLPFDGAEITISRTLFRDGESEYAINGTTCRLLDVQELLGDSGVGRQQHMIIGQGQLDSVLNSRPEERRAVIEEAAGVLKHRRRKERAERRLASTQENLERLGDLVREVRRQMRPLERQAVAARSFADVEADLRATRRYAFYVRHVELGDRQRTLDEQLRDGAARDRDLRHEIVTLDAQLTAATAEMASRREESMASSLGTLQALAERARGTRSVISERRRSLDAALAAAADENVIASLESESAKWSDELSELEAEERSLGATRSEIDTARATLQSAEDQFDATWGGNSLDPATSLESLREQIEVVASSRDRADAAVSSATARHRAEEERREQIEIEAALRTAEAEAAKTETARRSGARESRRRELAAAEAALVGAERDHRRAIDATARAQARAEALERALEELSGTTPRDIVADLDGVVGSFLDLVDVDSSFERAVEAAVGASLGAVVVENAASARGVIEALRRAGGAGMVLPADVPTGQEIAIPTGCSPLRPVVRARGSNKSVSAALDALLRTAVVAPNWESALDASIGHPDLVVVTPDGDRFAPSGWRVSAGRSVVTRGAVEEAQEEAVRARRAAEGTATSVETAELERDAARAAFDEATVELTEAESSESRLAVILDGLRAARVECDARLASLAGEAAVISRELATIDAELTARRAQLPALERAVEEADQRAGWADEARATVDAHRARVVELVADLAQREARLAERRAIIERRRNEVEGRLEGHHVERAEAASRRRGLESDLAVLGRLDGIVTRTAEEIAITESALTASYHEQVQATRAGAERVEDLRRQRAVAEARLGEVSDAVRHAEIEHAEIAVRISNLHESVRRDLSEEPEDLLDATAPDLPDDVTLEQRLAELEARISSLGPINPLALEELTALEDRYKELDTQVSDVRHARRELQEVLRTLDEEIMASFSAAVADVNEHFSALISMLFPGGQGRLILTEPENPLNTGVEIEVRPMGRNIRRISLLSGGERSMAALAFLFAVFRSRPSPFYLMDEVEAALDDVNLQRFLSLVDEFRDEAQLLIVTHQKRTMEAADALYGVTMAPGGSSRVVSQRVTRREGELIA